jgi:hypothetical protein
MASAEMVDVTHRDADCMLWRCECNTDCFTAGRLAADRGPVSLMGQNEVVTLGEDSSSAVVFLLWVVLFFRPADS